MKMHTKILKISKQNLTMYKNNYIMNSVFLVLM